ncbi:MAG TPA: Fe-S cluster assembly protein SufD [Casimicrobiaceae bacterium]
MNTRARDRILAEFSRGAPLLPGTRLPWLIRARQAALERFADHGFPTTRDEDWKYTSVAAIEKRNFAVLPPGTDGVTASEVGALRLGSASDHLLVFVNGWYAPALSSVGQLPAGVIAGSLADALDSAREALEPLFADGSDETVLGALNAAFMTDGAFLHLPGGAAIDEPVHLLFIATNASAAIHPRNVIVAAHGAHATVIEHYAGPAGVAYFTNAVTRIIARDNAAVEHYKLQQEGEQALHIAGIHVAQGRASRFASHSIALGAALARNDIATTFAAEGCQATLNGLYLTGGRQHVDHHTRIDHAKPGGTSREHYRGILDGASRAVFSGRVIVHKDAQRTDAHQDNHNLLLSKHAEVDTKPQLEIYADDVKCTHGATVGNLDEAQMFYLRSRGIEEAMAKSLLVRAFAHDVIECLRIAPLRNLLQETLLRRLPQEERIEELA